VSLHAYRAAPLRLTQISDCHLSERAGGCLLEMDTDQSLQAVLALVRRERPRTDLLLATGDLSDSGSAAAYRRLLHATRDLAQDSRWLPGNHDDAGTLRAVLGSDPRGRATALHGNWLVIALNTVVPGEVGGYLGAAELSKLHTTLTEYPGHHALIALHHHVLPMGCAWLDEIGVANAEAFWRAIAPFPQVRAIVGGHVHMESDRMHRGVRVLTSPSTCVQFAPGSDEFRVDAAAPGYRWLDLHPDGGIDTAVSRVNDRHFQVDLDASGY
jgi:Icc protein